MQDLEEKLLEHELQRVVDADIKRMLNEPAFLPVLPDAEEEEDDALPEWKKPRWFCVKRAIVEYCGFVALTCFNMF